MISGLVRTFAIGWSALLIALIGMGSLSPGRIGALTWGPTHEFWAISIAISEIEFGLKGKLGYRELSQVLADRLTTKKSDVDVNDEGTLKLVQQPDLVTSAIQAAAQIRREDLKKPKDGEALKTWKAHGGFLTTLAEDVGYSDFYNIAFRIFGYNSKSTHLLYISILALSFGLFVLIYWRENLPIAILALGITALFLVTTSSLLGHPTVPSVAANRFLSTLAIVPLLHIVATTAESRPLFIRDILVLMVQIMIVALSMSARSSAQWAAIAALLFALSLGILHLPPPRIEGCWRMVSGWHRSLFLMLKIRERRMAEQPLTIKTLTTLVSRFFRSSRLVVVPTLLLFTLISASLVERTRLDSIYFSDDILPHHLIWHSAYIGLTYHPRWQERVPIKELAGLSGDSVPFTLSQIYLRNKGIPYIGGAAGNLQRMRLHDRVIRSAYIDFLLKNPGYSAKLFLYYKPKHFLLTIKSMVQSIPGTAWMLAAISISLSAALMGIGRKKLPVEILFATGIIFLCSLLPIFWAYPSFIVMADQLWASLFLGMSLIAYGVAGASRWRSAHR